MPKSAAVSNNLTLDKLPDHALLAIFEWLGPSDHINIKRTCRKFLNVYKDYPGLEDLLFQNWFNSNQEVIKEQAARLNAINLGKKLVTAGNENSNPEQTKGDEKITISENIKKDYKTMSYFFSVKKVADERNQLDDSIVIKATKKIENITILASGILLIVFLISTFSAVSKKDKIDSQDGLIPVSIIFGALTLLSCAFMIYSQIKKCKLNSKSQTLDKLDDQSPLLAKNHQEKNNEIIEEHNSNEIIGTTENPMNIQEPGFVV